MAVKITKRELQAAFIVSANLCPAQLFRIIRSLPLLPEDKQNGRELAIGFETSANYFTDKDLSLCQDFLAMIDIVKELEAPCLSLCPILDHFSQLSQRILSWPWLLCS